VRRDAKPIRDAPGAMAEIRRLRIASAPSTVCLHGPHDGTPGGCASWMPRWQIYVNVNVSSNRGESELKSCENPQVSISATAESHGLTSGQLPLRPGLGNRFRYHCALISDTLSPLTGPGHRTLEDTLEGD
jgi:hypothetical protein